MRNRSHGEVPLEGGTPDGPEKLNLPQAQTRPALLRLTELISHIQDQRLHPTYPGYCLGAWGIGTLGKYPGSSEALLEKWFVLFSYSYTPTVIA